MGSNPSAPTRKLKNSERCEIVKSTIEKISATRVKLSIDVPFTDLQPHINDAYKSISERVNIPGFRKEIGRAHV